jgi:carbon storage regulator CsrA
MLVLTRKLHEQIKIGQDITVTIVRLHRNQVRIGIEAPAHVRVLRGELPRRDTDPHTRDKRTLTNGAA